MSAIKGKPWTKKEEQTLIKLVKEGESVSSISASLGKNKDAVSIKMKRLGLEVVVAEKKITPTTTSRDSKPSGSLPSIQETLKELNGAIVALRQPGLDKNEATRLRVLVQALKAYKELFVDFVHYCELEAELVDLRRKYEELNKKGKNVPAR